MKCHTSITYNQMPHNNYLHYAQAVKFLARVHNATGIKKITMNTLQLGYRFVYAVHHLFSYFLASRAAILANSEA